MLQDSPMARQFIDKLIEAKGLDGLDAEIKTQLHEELLHQLEETISRNIVNELPKEKLEIFIHVLNENSIDKIQSFLHNEHINIHEVLARSMGEFQAKYLEA